MMGGLAYVFKWPPESINAITVPGGLLFWNDRMKEINERIAAETRRR